MAQIELIDEWFAESLKPDPIMTVSAWADEHRVLSKKASSEAGRWRTSRTPYLKEIMDCLSITNPAKKIVFKKASQVGGTECGNNWIGYIIDHAPGPTMLVMPTVNTAKRNSKLRIDPLIEESPRLRSKVSSAKSRDSSNTTEQKDFDGGTLIMTGANSAAGLKSTPCRFVMLDELDEYPRNVEEQGDPVSLVMARSRTFSRRKAFLVSTPTIDGMSKIDEEYLDSDQRRYFVPCPHCDHMQELQFENLQWPEGEPQKVLYFCEGCGEGIEERYKTKMLEAGEWRARNPGHETIGFFLNSLYSPVGWFSWAEIAKDYEEAKREMEKEKKTEKMMTFTNTVLGRTWKEPGDAPEWKRLYLQRETYKVQTVPKGVAFLTCGVDVQKDRLELEVCGWGRGKESWSIAYEVLVGDPATEAVWNDLEKYIGKTFRGEDGREFPIRITAIDSGYQTQNVYNFCRRFPSNRVVAVKGSDSLSVIVGLPKIVDVKFQGRIIRRAVKVWTIGVSILKSELYGWLKLDPPIGDEPTPMGFCHFPEYDEEYFKQLTAEKVVVKRDRKGFVMTEWVKERERNEALDTRIYNRAAASMVGLDRMREQDFDSLEKVPIAKPIKSVENPNKSRKKVKREKSSKRSSSFW